jgi:hypothetical protein
MDGVRDGSESNRKSDGGASDGYGSNKKSDGWCKRWIREQ